MRIVLPRRVPVAKAFVFSAVLALVELVEGTGPLYVALVFTFFMVSVFAFNIAGGFTRPSGAYIFFYATLAGGVGTVFKALLGQPADTHLQAPITTIAVYTVTVGVMLVVAFLTRKIATSVNGIAGVFQVPQMNLKTSAMGCLVVVFLINLSFSLFPGGNGSILHAIAMLNYFLPLGILLGTVSVVRESNGTRSTSILTLCAMTYGLYGGLLAFSKQTMFMPFACWLFGAAWAGLRIRLRHVICILAFAFVAEGFMVPLSNVGRVDAITGSTQERLGIVEKYIADPALLYRTNKERVAAYAGADYWYYGQPQGLMDRLTMLPNDGQLIAFTEQGHYFGYYPILVYFQNWVPHYLDPNKLEGVYVGGNRYAHEMGQLAEDDWSTGISYSPSAEAFHLDGWRAVLLLQPCIFLLLFVTADFLCGDLRAQPWGLLPMLLFSHIAPEGLLGAAINYVWLGNLATIFCIFISGYVTPIFGKLLSGRERAPMLRANLMLPSADGSTGLEGA